MEPIRIFIDSGAFSAWRLKKPVDINKYCAWLHQNLDWIECYAALDSIRPDDPELAAQESYDNLLFMRKQGLNPIPVWHIRESVDWLHRMLDLGCEYIGLSGTSIDSMQATDHWLEMAWSHLVDSKGAPLVKVHAFGEARESCMKKFPWTSSDAATWIGAQQYGRLMMPDYNLGHTQSYASSKSSPDLNMIDGDEAKVFSADLEKYGVREDVFQDRKARSATVARALFAAYKWVKIEERVRASMPIRFIPRSTGLLTGAKLPEPMDPPLKENFYFYFGVGNNALTLPVLNEAQARNFLISYFYIDKDNGQSIKAYINNPEVTLRKPPYLRYYELLQRDVLVDGKEVA